MAALRARGRSIAFPPPRFVDRGELVDEPLDLGQEKHEAPVDNGLVDTMRVVGDDKRVALAVGHHLVVGCWIHSEEQKDTPELRASFLVEQVQDFLCPVGFRHSSSFLGSLPKPRQPEERSLTAVRVVSKIPTERFTVYRWKGEPSERRSHGGPASSADPRQSRRRTGGRGTSCWRFGLTSLTQSTQKRICQQASSRDVCRDTVRHPRRRLGHRFPSQLRVAPGRLHLSVGKQFRGLYTKVTLPLFSKCHYSLGVFSINICVPLINFKFVINYLSP